MSAKKKAVREKFNEETFKRDGHKCKMCGRTENLDAHHITDRHEMPNGGYVKENGITLCDVCHPKAEIWHQTGGQECPAGFTPAELYRKIGSSREIAIKKSEKL